jgi:predicted RND superfamily exporter protein
MKVETEKIDDFPVVSDIKDFNPRSGNILERLVFNNRRMMILICMLITLALAYKATDIVFNANFEKMIPQNHPYIKNYMANKNELKGLGNSIRVAVENTKGDIFDPTYLEVLKQINDELILTPGVDRPWVKSIWQPAVRWNEVTEEGYVGGPVMPYKYDGSKETIEQLRQNIARAGIVGSLVANDYKSCMVMVPLLDMDPATGKRIITHFQRRWRKTSAARGMQISRFTSSALRSWLAI